MIAVPHSTVVSHSAAGHADLGSARETSAALSGPYTDPASVPEDVRDRLLYRGGDPDKGPTKRAGCAECGVVFSTDRAFDAHVRADSHIDPTAAGLTWNSRGFYAFAASTVVDTKIVNAKTDILNGCTGQNEGAASRVGDVGEIAGRQCGVLAMRSIVPPLGRVAGDSTTAHHRSSTATRPIKCTP